MDRFRLAHLFMPILAVFLFSGSAFAAKAYTTDSQEVPLLSAPGKGKTIVMVPPASGVEPVATNNWTHVRYTTPGGEVRDGWVASKYLGARPPDSAVARDLGAQNASLKEQLDGIDKERNSLSQREKELTDKLTKLNAAYEELKAGSANFLKFKAEYDAAKSSLASAQENIQTLIQENENLKLSQRVQWFAAGAFVLLFGWFMGWITGKRQKKRRSTYY